MSERLGPPPVDPMSDLSWARIERGLWSTLDAAPPLPRAAAPASHRGRWMIVPGAVAAIAALWLVTRAAAPAPNDHVAPARVVSGASTSTLTLGDAYVTLDPESAVLVNHDPHAPVATLERGGASFAIAPRAGRPPFVVVAGDTQVRVVGTRFRVARELDVVTVEVEHGVVVVRHRGSEVQLRASERWSSAPSETAQVPAPTPTHEAPRAPVATEPPPRAAPVTRLPAKLPSTVDERATYEALAAREARDPAGALAGYRKLAQGTSRWAEIAMFAAARLAYDRRDPTTRALLSDYLRRFPRGANVDDARELLANLKGDPR